MKVGIAGKVEGAVDLLQRLALAKDPTVPRRAFPCAWMELFGECRKGAPACGPCACEAEGTKAHPWPPGVMAQVRKACAPALLAQMTK
eukprot:361254-Pleurochrysis_carterae.AAC.1